MDDDHATDGGGQGAMVAGSRRRDVVALIGVLVVVAVSAWIVREIHTSDNPVNSATVYGAYFGVATLMVTLLVFLLPWWWKGRRATAVTTTAELTAAADQLAQSMLDTWRQEAKNRRISTPAPVRVQWQWGPAEVTPSPAEVITAPVTGTGPRPLPEPNSDDPSPDPPGMLLDTGTVTRLHEEVYRTLPHGRLVLLGGPGAGKTGAMILLLLAALEHRRSVSEAQRSEVPVPVWLTLGGWDPATQTLHQWAAATMYRDHPYLRAPDYGSDAAGELLRAERVALFLDGLDEMAPSAQRRALARVEQEGAGLRLVLSSRPEEYRQAISQERVYNTAVLEVQPVDPDTARNYLQRDQIGSQHNRWTQVGDYLTHHPDSIAAHTLNNPLTLSLARLTYQGQDPTVLTDPTKFATVAAMREHLIDRILITAYPDEGQRAHATRWLAWIAHHLDSDRDLAWWHIPTWIPRWQRRLAFGLAFGLMAGLAFGAMAGLAFGLIGGLTFGLMAGEASGERNELRVISPRWPRPRELCRLLVFGLVVGVAFGLVGGLVSGLTVGLRGGLAVGLMVGFAALLNLWTFPLSRASAATPTASYRNDRRTGIVVGFGGGLAVGLMVGLAGGLMGGLMLGFMVGLVGGSMRVSLTEVVLATTGAGKVNFIRVLEDAYHRQVLRQAGAVYQFRHAELQDHLAKIHRSHIPSDNYLSTKP